MVVDFNRTFELNKDEVAKQIFDAKRVLNEKNKAFVCILFDGGFSEDGESLTDFLKLLGEDTFLLTKGNANTILKENVQFAQDELNKWVADFCDISGYKLELQISKLVNSFDMLVFMTKV